MDNNRKQWDTYHTKGIRKKYLFRYGPDWKVTSFLESQSLYMTKMSNFDDKLEGISTYDITELRLAYENCFIEKEKDIIPSMLEEWQRLKARSRDNLIHIFDKVRKTQNAHFVSCWFNSDRESDGMWRFYAGDGGFAIKLERMELQQKVKASLTHNLGLNDHQTIIAGRIKYQDFPRVIEKEKQSQVKYLAFRKDLSFAHENEYRIVLVDVSEEAQGRANETYELVGFNDLQITLIAHPKTSNKRFEKYKSEFESYGENIKVVKSELEAFYQLPERINEIKT